MTLWLRVWHTVLLAWLFVLLCGWPSSPRRAEGRVLDYADYPAAKARWSV